MLVCLLLALVLIILITDLKVNFILVLTGYLKEFLHCPGSGDLEKSMFFSYLLCVPEIA